MAERTLRESTTSPESVLAFESVGGLLMLMMMRMGSPRGVGAPFFGT